MSIGLILFLLIGAHALFDFPLQGDAIAINKNRNKNTPLQKEVPWYYWMAAHAFTHGMAVALITQSVALGICETIAHFAIDCGKCESKYSIHVDQLLHLLCKVLWVVILNFGL